MSDPRFEVPDAGTLAWAASQLRSPATSVVRRLGGGLDAATHLIRSTDGQEAVLRRATGPREDWRAVKFRREGDVFALLQGTGLPVARLIAADLEAEYTDVPAMLVSRVPGRLRYPAHPSVRFIAEIARAANMIHTLPVPDLVWPWSSQRARLERFLETGKGSGWDRLRQTGIPDAALSFVHGDLWTGNLLYEADLVTGIVDWGDAGVGYPGLEVAHSAADLQVGTGSDDAHDHLMDAYEQLRGPLAHRAWWEVAGFLIFPTDPADWLPTWTEAGLPITADEARRRHASGLNRALNRLS